MSVIELPNMFYIKENSKWNIGLTPGFRLPSIRESLAIANIELGKNNGNLWFDKPRHEEPYYFILGEIPVDTGNERTKGPGPSYGLVDKERLNLQPIVVRCEIENLVEVAKYYPHPLVNVEADLLNPSNNGRLLILRADTNIRNGPQMRLQSLESKYTNGIWYQILQDK